MLSSILVDLENTSTLLCSYRQIESSARKAAILPETMRNSCRLASSQTRLSMSPGITRCQSSENASTDRNDSAYAAKF